MDRIGKVILSKVALMYKDKHGMYVLPYKWILAIQYRITILQYTDQRKLNNKEDPREDSLRRINILDIVGRIDGWRVRGSRGDE